MHSYHLLTAYGIISRMPIIRNHLRLPRSVIRKDGAHVTYGSKENFLKAGGLETHMGWA